MEEKCLTPPSGFLKSLFYASKIVTRESYQHTRSKCILNVSDSDAIVNDYKAVYKEYSRALKNNKNKIQWLENNQRQRKAS
ncbi:hypothetical protein EUA69_01800 [TM7 phylum sp. oral taxon 352]|nr:hypothetical protein EUA73_02445 [TM7 phylum sp. oral taxon 352]TWP15476.1 hypothetical protein EUA74_01850 [TM7 phylum sp. oral taxon 352]TWP16854.1 hypothetical protein EUA69_01800 [TM7 phylum sp. oral taxon 352]TWP18470.1 hypothetical protein EUA71_02025 [TM7 phylum sp. oral taxon 352]